MSYRRFNLAEIAIAPAKIAKVAKEPAETVRLSQSSRLSQTPTAETEHQTFASFATFAGRNAEVDVPALGVDAAEFEERAAVLEYDEGLPREEAERLATEQAERTITATPCSAVSFSAVSGRPSPTAATGCEPKLAPKPPVASPALRSPGWHPQPGPGIRIVAPAVEVDPVEYDAHADALIAALPEASFERSRMEFTKRKGWVLEHGSKRIFVKGRF